MVAQAILRDLETVEREVTNDNQDSDGQLPFSDSEGEDQKYLQSNVNYESWKMRELRRIKRDREERRQRETELKEIERRRNMTDEQRMEENLRLGTDHTKKP